MSIKWHARALVVSQILIFLPVILFWVSVLEKWSVPAQLVTVVPLLLLAALLPFLVFGHVIAARCPDAGCRGKAYPGLPKPASNNRLIYRCERCSRTFNTGIEYDGLGPS